MLWHGKTGRNLGSVDTNQLKNNMAGVSPNGRFIAAAAFTADVKVCTLNCLLQTIMFNDQKGNYERYLFDVLLLLLAGEFSHHFFKSHHCACKSAVNAI